MGLKGVQKQKVGHHWLERQKRFPRPTPWTLGLLLGCGTACSQCLSNDMSVREESWVTTMLDGTQFLQKRPGDGVCAGQTPAGAPRTGAGRAPRPLREVGAGEGRAWGGSTGGTSTRFLTLGNFPQAPLSSFRFQRGKHQSPVRQVRRS